jgi:uncharacterized protein (TIGR00297 family)
MQQFLQGFVLGTIFAGASYGARFLKLSGALATAGLATVIFGVGGWKWTLPIVSFFVLSSLLSKVGRKKKKRFDSVFEKSGTRDYGQVLANGGVGGLLAVGQYLYPSFDFYLVYAGSIAAVTADTWATEIGLLTPGKTVSLATLRRVDPGISGGVSWVGIVGGALGACVISVSISPWMWDYKVAAWLVIAGVGASVLDSFIGATLQAEYECVVCGRTTERAEHCGMPTRLVRGKTWINNDVVNWVCAFCGALVMYVVNLF